MLRDFISLKRGNFLAWDRGRFLLAWGTIFASLYERAAMEKKNTQKFARIVLGGALIVAGVSHLSFARKEFQAQVPDWVPLEKDETVVLSGIAEIVLGVALTLAGEKRKEAVGKMAAGFFTAVLPGNISQYTHDRKAFGLDSRKKRLARLFFQPALVYWALKSTER
jgi:uncharacterized membrane protein